jgi:hypothetical protein
MKNALAVTVLLLTAAACGSSDDDNFTCVLGELTGTWRVHYDETNGSCGPLEDETGIFGLEVPPGCDVQSRSISDDKCGADMAWACPTTDDLGTQQWVMVVEHTKQDRLSGTGTMQLVHPSLGTCRSTYAITITRL